MARVHEHIVDSSFVEIPESQVAASIKEQVGETNIVVPQSS